MTTKRKEFPHSGRRSESMIGAFESIFRRFGDRIHELPYALNEAAHRSHHEITYLGQSMSHEDMGVVQKPKPYKPTQHELVTFWKENHKDEG